MSEPILSADAIPPALAPAALALLAEIARRIPPFLGPPPRIAPHERRDPEAVAEAVRAFLAWLESAPTQWGSRIEELESLFQEMAAAVHELDGRVRRLTQHARAYAAEQETLSISLSEALDQLGPLRAADPVVPTCRRILEALRAEARRERDGARQLGEEASEVRTVLTKLADRLDKVERKARALRSQSLRDPLTGLWNRGAWDDRLAEEAARARRYGQPFSVILWDVDRFKEVNDRHGHLAGDMVLQALAGRTLQALRRSDFVARYGGEEFAVLLPHTEEAAARIVAEKIRRLGAEKDVATRAGPVRVTLSAGVATWAPGEEALELLDRADQALYRAKEGGRNRVEVAPPPGRKKKAAVSA
ncbi:GGDEF domain-containing protein [Deferrisoma palaeochoriense]